MPSPSFESTAPVKLVEVGPRDGLQFVSGRLTTDDKLEWIGALFDAGLRHIEVTSFVSSKRLPQFSDAAEVVRRCRALPGLNARALVPNLTGCEHALAAGIGELAVFTSASEPFVERNLGCSVTESLTGIRAVLQRAGQAGVPVRGYLSMVVGCPWQGWMAPQATLCLASKLLDLGCYEISLGDTIGIATPADIERLLETLLAKVPAHQLALHCHNTYGQALANIWQAYRMGVTTFDASLGGLGGCPFAPGASGNVATEDVAYLFRRQLSSSGIALTQLAQLAERTCRQLGVSSDSHLSQVSEDAIRRWSEQPG